MNAPQHAPAAAANVTTVTAFDLDAALEEAGRALLAVQAVGGDTTKLTTTHRQTLLEGLSRALGLNPLSQPVIFLKTQGREVLYVTKVGTDQIASRAKLKRRTIQGPELRKIAGRDIVYCQVEVTAPDGRSETATATLPLSDIVNDLMKCECVPLDSEILTRRGFKRHGELTIGEEVLAYDAAADRTEWVPLENVTVYADAPVFRFATERGGFSMRCTRDHSWAVDTQGAQGRKLIEANAVKTHHRVKIAARAVDGGADLSPVDAAVLGWVMCDGTIQRRGNYLRLGIYQSKPDRVAEIRELLTRAAVEFNETRGEATTRTFPGGNTSECLPQHSFWLTAEASRGLLARAGIEGPSDLPRLAAHLSSEARRAMLDAMMAADGSGGRFGKKRKPGVMEAWQILCTLEGVALGKLGVSSAGEVPQQQMLSYDYVAGSNLSLVPDGDEAVWCPTTKHGTWVMRQGGRISITGNTKAKRRATLSLVGLGLLAEDELETMGSDATSGDVPNGDPVTPWLEALAKVKHLGDIRAVYNSHVTALRIGGVDGRDAVRAWLCARGLLAVESEVTAVLSTMSAPTMEALDLAALEPTDNPEPTPDADAIVRAARKVRASGGDEHSVFLAWKILGRSYGSAKKLTLNAAAAALKDLCEKPDPDGDDEPPPNGTDGRGKGSAEDGGDDASAAAFEGLRAAHGEQASADWRASAAGITAHVATLGPKHLENSGRAHLRAIRASLREHALNAYADRLRALSQRTERDEEGNAVVTEMPARECFARVEGWLREGSRVAAIAPQRREDQAA